MRQIDKTGQKIIKQTVPIHGPIFSLPPRIPVTVIVIKIERTMPLSIFQISPSTIYEKNHNARSELNRTAETRLFPSPCLGGRLGFGRTIFPSVLRGNIADFKWHDEQRHVEESKYGCGVGLVVMREALLMLRLIAGLRMPGPLEEEEEG